MFWAGEQLYAVDAGGKLSWPRPALAAAPTSVEGLWTGAGLVVAAATSGLDPGDLFAIQAADGTQLWKEAVGRYGDLAVGMADGGGVLVVSQRDTGSLYAVDAATGQTRWTFHDPAATVDLSWPVAADGGRVFTVYGSTVRAFDI